MPPSLGLLLLGILQGLCVDCVTMGKCLLLYSNTEAGTDGGEGATASCEQSLFLWQYCGDCTLSKHISPEETPDSFLFSIVTLLWCELI